jgi:flagellar protein FliJ
MSESRAQRMQVVLLLARQQEAAAAQQLTLVREQLNSEAQQLRELNDYKDQYLLGRAQLRSGIRPQELINFTNFMGRLNQACSDQSVKIARIEQQLGLVQKKWREKYQKRKSLEELIVQIQKGEAAELDKLLQKELDEFSSLQSGRNDDFRG